MKTILFSLTGLAIVIASFGCKHGKTVMVDGKTMKIKDLMQIKTDPKYVQPVSNAAFTIEDWSIEGDVAKIAISYSGGCGKHIFKAFFTGNYMKSMPPKATIFIQHDNGGDKCRMLIMDTLYVYLQPVRYEKEKTGSVIIGFNNTEKTVEYSYKGIE